MNATARRCNGCTACCDGWVRILVQGFEARPGQPCPHSTGSGCDDYANRPADPCVNFNCGWVVPQSPLPDWMKPDKAKVLVLFNKTNWQGVPVDLALPVGRRIPGRCLDWLKAFAQRQRRLLLYAEQVKEQGRFSGEQLIYAFGPPAFRAAIAEQQQRGAALW
ncbi:MAG: hypothetical protein LJE69_13755 [Thiohalocapsa sp.]|uniref:hypothetical protein n=1 Tax=Thiohalocapsa sp. TaxID=2497641 RepID=UPI0025F1452D|nr:hypothetical protein [Thiohalocapsa sp.]MCG6942301.1 hypothetical protein [Thiohalocapsa sp.]